MLQLAGDSAKALGEFKQLQAQGTIYQVDCIAEAGHIDKIHNSKEGQEAFKRFYSYLEQMDHVDRVVARTSMNLYIETSHAKGNDLAERIEEGVSSFSTLRVSGNFFDFADLDLLGGRQRIISRFQDFQEGKRIPVVLGSNFQTFYEEGEMFFDSSGRQYEVMGFLKAGEAYAAPFESEKAIILDNWMMVPRLAEPLSEGIGYLTDLVSTYFLTEDESLMEKIVQKAHNLNLLPFEYRSLEEQIARDINDLKNEALTMGSVMVLIFVFATTGMISYMIRYIQQRLREFAIHSLCGARNKALIFRIFMQVGAPSLIADIWIIVLFQQPLLITCIILFSFLYDVV